MTKSTHARAAGFLLAGSLFLLGGCDRGDETAPPPPEAPESPATRNIEPAPPLTEEPTSPPNQDNPAQSPPATQSGGGGATQGAAAGGGDMETTLTNAGCLACHEVGQKKIGPAYAWVAHRYQNEDNAVETLVASVRNGSSGKWTDVTGGIPMPPNSHLPEDQVREMVQWILDREPQEPPS
ncbi:MAG: hypothetical protein RQ736_14220 [Thiogranum sp.]|nr:hypothetical protein [Thiogranum sp.]